LELILVLICPLFVPFLVPHCFSIIFFKFYSSVPGSLFSGAASTGFGLPSTFCFKRTAISIDFLYHFSTLIPSNLAAICFSMIANSLLKSPSFSLPFSSVLLCSFLLFFSIACSLFCFFVSVSIFVLSLSLPCLCLVFFSYYFYYFSITYFFFSNCPPS